MAIIMPTFLVCKYIVLLAVGKGVDAFVGYSQMHIKCNVKGRQKVCYFMCLVYVEAGKSVADYELVAKEAFVA